jgi:hypothetical protein
MHNGDNFLETAIHYLAAIHVDHDVFNRENLIPYLETRCPPTELLQKLASHSAQLALGTRSILRDEGSKLEAGKWEPMSDNSGLS